MTNYDYFISTGALLAVNSELISTVLSIVLVAIMIISAIIGLVIKIKSALSDNVITKDEAEEIKNEIENVNNEIQNAVEIINKSKDEENK